ncbi:MAG: glycosyltransferase family 39 protein, partial [Chloroflexota bacterium]
QILTSQQAAPMRNAGGAGFGPLSIGEIYATIQADDPYQAIGYPLTVAAWGQLVGWSEFASRVSSLLFTLLGMALTYRLGVFTSKSAWVGGIATLVFGFSSFTVFYAHELRAFSFVTIFAALTLLAYLHLLKTPTNRMWLIAFIIGGAGLLYAHYYAAMLLIGLGMYHLLAVPKNKNWLIVPACGIAIGILFLPQFPAFMEGFTRFDPADVEKTPMALTDVLTSLLYFITNGLEWVAVLLMGAGVWLAIREANPRLRAIVSIAILSTAVLIISNEFLDILEPTRLRYAIFLWSLYAVWIAAGMVWLAQQLTTRTSNKRLSPVILSALIALWSINAVRANYSPTANDSIEGTETPRMLTIISIIEDRGAAGDLFAFYNGTSQQAWYIQDTLAYSVSYLPMQTMTTSTLYDFNEPTRQWAREQITNTERIWYGANRTFGLNEVHTDFLAYITEEQNFILCEAPVMNDELSLDLYARSTAFCHTDDALITWENVALTGYTTELTDDTLALNLGFELASAFPPDTYSLAIHVLEGDNPAPVTQTDIPLPYDSFLPLRVNLNTSDLPAGDYTLALIIYNPATGERLIGQVSSGENPVERLPLTDISLP